jgi:alcohol dehydrogenase (NADP+)
MKDYFEKNSQAIDPASIKSVTLNNGILMPSIGIGTFGSDLYSSDQVADAVIYAAEFGQRSFDCASVYGNEQKIGEAFQVILEGGVSREELFITSKVWNDMHGEGEVIASCKQTLSDLGLDYLDLYLVHWPFPNFHPPGCSVESRSPDSKPYIHADYMIVWRQMEQLVEEGLVRSIGTSNMTIPKMNLLLEDCQIKPVVNEMELHPHFQQQEFVGYLVKHDIQPIGFCPIGSPKRPERDKTESDTVDIEDPIVGRIAERLGVHPAVVCLKWAVQRGVVPIPFSVTPSKIESNLRCALSDQWVLTDAEMQELATIDKKCRLIKGQVFLWEAASGWEALWDLDGIIES